MTAKRKERNKESSRDTTGEEKKKTHDPTTSVRLRAPTPFPPIHPSIHPHHPTYLSAHPPIRPIHPPHPSPPPPHPSHSTSPPKKPPASPPPPTAASCPPETRQTGSSKRYRHRWKSRCRYSTGCRRSKLQPPRRQ